MDKNVTLFYISLLTLQLVLHIPTILFPLPHFTDAFGTRSFTPETSVGIVTGPRPVLTSWTLDLSLKSKMVQGSKRGFKLLVTESIYPLTYLIPRVT